ncbi:MAG TPA: AMP-binding protein [Chthonomonadaceae bacterium]|nr:AMP-binding protein [Chthonomonadaceae bacterium]
MPLQDAILRGSRDYPSRPALLFEDRTWSYEDLNAITDRIATNLLAAGLQPGDRVGLLFANGPGIVFSYYACFKAGLIAVPLNIRMKGPELAYVLNHSGCRMLLGQADLYRALEPVRADIPALERCYIEEGEPTILGDQPFEALQQEAQNGPELPAVGDDEIAVIIYTSGTTARPKGVMHPHEVLHGFCESNVAHIREKIVVINAAVPSLAHIGSLGGIMLTTYHAGGTMLVFSQFDPKALLEGIQKHRVTGFWLLPVMYAALLQVPDIASYDLSSLRLCLSAGDSLPTPIRERFRALCGREIVEFCGMTEIPYCCNPLDEGNRPGSIGKPVPGVRIRLVDDQGAEVPRGEVGEILAQSKIMMRGYWRDPEATAQTMQGGWIHTGDLAWEDADGYYWFAGRKKDIILRGGSNIAPAEVEEALCTHPAVFAAGVVGAPDPIWGQAVWAFVALRPNAHTDEAELKEHLQGRLADYKLPETIRILPALPIGLTGKIHRQTLREWAAQAK